MLKSKPTLWLLLATALYAVGQLVWYLPTPLGESPVLDGQENLILAAQISSDTLAPEPFYRAMLYPFILAYWPTHWAILGLLAHLANTYLVYRLSLRIWKHLGGALISGALVGLNPILLHYAFDPLDITLALTLFLLGLTFVPEALSPSRFADRWIASSLAGFFLGLACLARPHFFAVLAPAAIIAIVAVAIKKVEWQRSFLFLLLAAIPIAAYGLVQLSGPAQQFKVLPWQGAYNLWASNKPDANGLYLKQTIEFHTLEEHKNPTRLESETLYQQEAGKAGTIDERSDYWRRKTLNSILSHPGQWLRLMAHKTYALFNNYEQYNNKTFSYHKKLSPWLRYNPISWGILLVLATASVSMLWRQSKKDIIPLIAIGATFSAGILLYMASGRFRLPLVPLLAIFAGGLPFAIKAFKASSAKTRRNAAVATGIVALATFSFFADINSKDTYIQDTLLLADASAKRGRDSDAIQWASAALAIDPDRQAAKRIRLISRYNQMLTAETDPDASFWKTLAQESAQITLQDEILAYINGLALWNTGKNDEAIRAWSSDGCEKYGMAASSCLAAIMTVDPSAVQLDVTPELLSSLKTGQHPILAYALARDQAPAKRTVFLESIQMNEASYMQIEKSLQRVIPH